MRREAPTIRTDVPKLLAVARNASLASRPRKTGVFPLACLARPPDGTCGIIQARIEDGVFDIR